MAMPPQVPAEAPSYWLVSFTVAELDVALDTAAGLGALVVEPPVEPADGRFAVLDDPGGATFALFALRAQGVTGGTSGCSPPRVMAPSVPADAGRVPVVGPAAAPEGTGAPREG